MKNSENILILDAQTTQALPVFYALKKNDYYVTAFCSSKKSYGYKSKYPDKKLICPVWAEQPEEFHHFFFNYIKNNKVDAIIPMNDDSATFLSINKKEVLKFSKVTIPDYDIFDKAYDKNKLMALCQKFNYPHPKTADLDKLSIENACNYVGYPAILKPNITSGARGMKIINSVNELKSVYPEINKEYGSCHLQKYVKSGGRQIKVQLFTDNKDILITSVLEKIRFYPEKGGSSTLNKTIIAENLVNICSSVLKKIGWVGFADFDMIEDTDDGIIKIMEINPRIPASIRGAFKSGIDYATIIADYTLNKNLKQYKYFPGKYLRYLGLDILWFIKSKNKFKTKPGWFNFFGKNIYYQDGSWQDPIPFIFGNIENIKKQLNPDFRKSKSGLE